MSDQSSQTAPLWRDGRMVVSASELKNGWHTYLELVSQSGEEIVITRYGKPVALLLPIKSDADAGHLTAVDARP